MGASRTCGRNFLFTGKKQETTTMTKDSNLNQTNISNRINAITRFGLIEMLVPLAPKASLLRAFGVRIVVHPETFEALMAMGLNAHIIVANAWIADDETNKIYSASDWISRKNKIASGELTPDGKKPSWRRKLLSRFGFAKVKR